MPLRIRIVRRPPFRVPKPNKKVTMSKIVSKGKPLSHHIIKVDNFITRKIIRAL
jgi:hypothetical protein